MTPKNYYVFGCGIEGKINATGKYIVIFWYFFAIGILENVCIKSEFA